MEKELHPVALSAPIIFAAREAGKAPGPHPCSGVAYGGGIITDHPLFPRVAFDLATTRVVYKAKIKKNHGTAIGQIDASAVDKEIRYTGHIYPHIKPEAKEVLDMASEGYEWQASVGLWPGRTEHIKAGASIDLNGQKMAGPLTVFRNNRIREISVCDLGADDTTSAQFFAIGDTADSGAQQSEQNQMEQVSKEEHDRIVGELNGKITAQDATIKTVEASAKATADALALMQTELKARADADKALAATARETSVKALFTAMGLEFKAETAAPYLAMDDATFAAVNLHMKAIKPKAPAHLFSVQATAENAAPGALGPVIRAAMTDENGTYNAEGVRAVQMQAGDLAARARAHIAEQKKLGIDVPEDEAVMFVAAQAA